MSPPLFCLSGSCLQPDGYQWISTRVPIGAQL